MWSVIQFVGENVYRVCSVAQIKAINGQNRVKWKGASYAAGVLFRGSYLEVTSLHRNLNNGWPVVALNDISYAGMKRVIPFAGGTQNAKGDCQENCFPVEVSDSVSDLFIPQCLHSPERENVYEDMPSDPYETDSGSDYYPPENSFDDDFTSKIKKKSRKKDVGMKRINSFDSATHDAKGDSQDMPADQYETDSGSDYNPLEDSCDNFPSEMKKHREKDAGMGSVKPFYSTTQNSKRDCQEMPADQYETDSVSDYNPLADSHNNSPSEMKKQRREKVTRYFEEELNIPTVPHSKQPKKYYCLFCMKFVSKFPRHVESVHRDENAVKEFIHLPKNCTERTELISKLRKHFLFIYNTDRNYNKGTLIPTRQPQEILNRKANGFKVCPTCEGFYAYSAFRRHFRKCYSLSKKGERDTFQKSRRTLGKVHKLSNDVVRNKIFPVMRDDEYVKCIRYDELAIVYANKLTEKFRSQHHCNMIRSRLRLIGRLLIEIKKNDNSVQNFSQLFDPKMYDKVIVACNRVAGFNITDMKYKAPATAFALGTLLKKCGKILINMCIKSEDIMRKNQTENFLKILEEEFSYSVNKTVQENQIMWKRQKKVELPSLQDIKKLNTYLKTQRQEHYQSLQNAFRYNDWKKLSELTLTSIQVFNRRRPGEIQRVLVDDFNKYESIDIEADKELFSAISENLLASATDYVRFSIRGKLGRNVPVLLNKDFLECIQILLKYRSNAKISPSNPYLFALPGESSSGFKYLSAYNLLRTFAYKCGAEKPHLLRATELRKHVATRSIMLNLQDRDVTDLARFMGHEKRIHEEHYQLPVASRDILKMSRFLENAQGEMDNVTTTEFIAENHYEETFSNVDITQKNKYDEKNGDENQLSSAHSSKRKRSSSPRGRVKRTSWSQCLKEKILSIFKNYIEQGRLPSIDHCADVIKSIPELENRSPVQLKSFINNQLVKAQKRPNRVRRSTIYWTDEEKRIMRRVFETNLKSGKLPSLHDCQEVIERNCVLQIRSKESVKAWVYNELKRRE